MLCHLMSVTLNIKHILVSQDSLPVVPPNCSSDNPATVRDFIEKGRAALVSVGIIRDTIVGITFCTIFVSWFFL